MKADRADIDCGCFFGRRRATCRGAGYTCPAQVFL